MRETGLIICDPKPRVLTLTIHIKTENISGHYFLGHDLVIYRGKNET